MFSSRAFHRSSIFLSLFVVLVLVFPTSTTAFSVISLLSTSVSRTPLLFQAAASPAAADAASDDSSKDSHNSASLSRRSLFQSVAVTSSGMLLSTMVPSVAPAAAAAAAQRVPLENSLYTILRVREATQQEARLIKTGKFKDVQRANVKLAVKFLIENYSLNDAFVAASTYLDGNDKRMAAVNVGQNAVQDLYTILEYFDASDVQNLKIGSSTLSADKESVVLKGLDATRRSIDEFLAYFPKDTVDTVKNKVKEENDLNFKEFDRSLGDILNPNPTTNT